MTAQQKFIDVAWNAAETALQSGGVGLLCMFCSEKRIVYAPAEGIEKEDFIGALPGVAKELNSEVVLILAEAWMTMHQEGKPFVRPSQSPDRVEVVIVNWKTKEGEEGGEVRTVVRDADGKVSIGEPLNQPGYLQGRFLENVFGKTTLH
jgi:hypothetical protein